MTHSTLASVHVLSAANTVGASASSQALAFAICFAFGLCAGIVSLLYFRPAKKAERALTDFFATLLIGGICLASIEFATAGKLEAYGIIALVLGAILSATVVRRVFKRK